MIWPEVKISDVCETGSGGTPARAKYDRYYHGTIPWVKSGELEDRLVEGTEEKITEEGLRESSAKLVQRDSVLIALYGATVGKTALLRIDAATNQAVCYLIPNRKVLKSEYLWFVLRSKQKELLAQRVGGAQPNISQAIIRKTKLPLPPLSEQRRIVEILDKADSLRKKRTEADKIAERIVPALFYKMFGDPLELIHSSAATFLDDPLVEIQNGFACGDKDVIGGSPHLRMNNIGDDGILNLNLVRTVPNEFDTATYRLKEGDVLFMGTNSQEKVGKACVFYQPDERTYLFSNHLVRIRILDKTLTPEFLASYLHLLWAKKYFQSKSKRWVNQASISIQTLKRTKIPEVDKNAVLNYSASFKTYLALVKKQQAALANLEGLFNVVMTRAFSGDLTAKWREAHMKELLQEMEEQAKELGG